MLVEAATPIAMNVSLFVLMAFLCIQQRMPTASRAPVHRQLLNGGSFVSAPVV